MLIAISTQTQFIHYLLFHTNQPNLYIRVNVHTPLSKEVDIEASMLVVSRNMYNKLWPSAQASLLECSDVQMFRWKSLNNVQVQTTNELTLSAVLTHHMAVFSNELDIIRHSKYVN